MRETVGSDGGVREPHYRPHHDILPARRPKLKHPRREIVPLMHPILGFRGQEVNPTGIICLALYPHGLQRHPRVVGLTQLRSSLHRTCCSSSIKQMMALLGNSKGIKGYLVRIWPLVERSDEQRPDGQRPSDKKPRVTLSPPTETITTCILTSGSSQPEPEDSLGGIFRLTLTLILGGHQLELNLVRVFAYLTSVTVALDILNVCLEVPFRLKIVRGHGLQEFPRSSIIFLARNLLDLRLDVSIFQLEPPKLPCPSLVFPSGACTWLLSPQPFAIPLRGRGSVPLRE
ncbi:hypothetical protein Cgig2_014130 [Carnegiea gigantea]|uniref:Uncharacterized protein n=1 Tax=Carnegiea gigantea TaxID=171969 RepID=A0A9Q1JYD5_9CARY|nr:hypothetical protein Cgig2_014130 [Carnegiea gigantea]